MAPFRNRLMWWIILVMIDETSATSFNQPQLCSNAIWSENGTTLVDNSTIGGPARGFFVNINNTIFVAAYEKSQILIWSTENVSTVRSISVKLFEYTALFVTINGDIYFENGYDSGRIEKWTSTSNNNTFVTNFVDHCFSLFVDHSSNLYCSLFQKHQVVKISLSETNGTASTVAGNGSKGSASNELDGPWGIFVDTNCDLYVAEAWNNRIQLFRSGQLNGTTVAGNGVPANLILNLPTDVILDADGYLYMADDLNNRVIRSGHDEWQCVIGCSGAKGSAPNQLDYAYSLRFDSHGNIYVADEYNSRIQKFMLRRNSYDTSKITTSAIVQTENQLSTIKQTINSQSVTSIQSSTTPTSTTVSSATASEILSCYPPIVALIPSIPIKFRRQQEIYITSNLQLRCSQSLSTTVNWRILLCTPTCSTEVSLNQPIESTMNNLFIPPRTFSKGLYEFRFTVLTRNFPALTSSSSISVEINQSTIITNLIPFVTSMLIHDYEQDLVLDPGQYSIDLNSIVFDSNIWYYKYYCRMNTTDEQGFRLFDDPDQNCFSNQSLVWKSNNSSFTIPARALQLNRTYQLMVQIINQQDPSLQSIGYLFVTVTQIQSPLIIINCVIRTLCSLLGTFYYVNPSTQLALYSVCMGNCLMVESVRWNIYRGSLDSSNQSVQWIPFVPTHSFGLNTKNLTLARDVFQENDQIVYWRLEVLYSFPSETSITRFDMQINESPKYGSCSIDPWNGTMLTLFTINCFNWTDEDDIRDYSFYAWTDGSLERMIIGRTTESTLQLRLPARVDSASVVHLVAYIQDAFGSVTKFPLTSVSVRPDLPAIGDLINQLEQSTSSSTSNPLVELLTTGDQNTIGHITASISQILNEMNKKIIHTASLSGVPSIDISITSLIDPTFNTVIKNSSDEPVLADIQKQINQHARVREYLMTFISNQSTIQPDDVRLQASILAKLTESTNQLTRKTSNLASIKCQHLSDDLKSMATKLSYEDLHLIATHLAECAINSFNGVNGVLQQRATILSLDQLRTNEDWNNCDTDSQCDWIDSNMISDEEDYSTEIILQKQNLHYQRQAANQILDRTIEIISSLTSSLNIHLNINQTTTINSSAIFFSLEKTTLSSFHHSQLYLPSNLCNNQTVLIRTLIQPLAFGGTSQDSSYTNLSRSFSFSILNDNGTEIPINTNLTNPIEFFIPRDPNFFIPSMFLQNSTSIDSFNLHQINLTQHSSLTFSVHLEISPLDLNVSYLVIHKFDTKPQWNDHHGWTLFSSSNLTKDGIYTYFLDNHQTSNHYKIIYGIRQVTPIEMDEIFNQNRSILNGPMKFLSNYRLRIYQSGCFYLDSNNNWQSDGLLVGPLTDRYRTHCFSTFNDIR